MEDTVLRAMARWPNVPAIAGWMRLTRRGTWLLRGNRVEHPNSLAFIAANYGRDDAGRYFFQNGPQRVFVDLDVTPWIYRFHHGTLSTHTQEPITRLESVLLDEDDNVYLVTERGPGILHDQDLLEAEACFTFTEGDQPLFCYENQTHAIEQVQVHALSTRFGFVMEPRTDDGTRLE